MSKKIKLENKKRNLLAKRARRAANKARYAELRRLGINSKSVRARRSGKRKLATSVDHPNGPCGNVGCKQCFPDLERRGVGL